MNRAQPIRRYGLGLAGLLLLTACGSGPDGDLVAYVKRVKSQRSTVQEAPRLPEKREIFRYRADSEGIRDPFVGQVSRVATQKRSGQGETPNAGRGRQALEQFPLESLILVGTMSSGDRTVALVRAGDGTIHQVRIGDYMGQNFGKVIAIEDRQIRLRELVPDGSGGWTERSATVSLAK